MHKGTDYFYRDIVRYKPDTFIGRYMSQLQDQETPFAYDFWCALWLLSLAVGRGTVVARPKAPVYLNLYVILCAESGVTRKSTAVKHAERIASKFLHKRDKHDMLVTTKMSPEAFTDHMHQMTQKFGEAHSAIAISELVTFMGKEKYVNAMPGLLTDLYDCPSSRSSKGTISRGKTLLNDVWISFLSASTPTWLAQTINPTVVEGGFTSRCFFIHAEKRKKKVAWPEDTVDIDAWLLSELERLRRIGSHCEEIAVHPVALAYFKRWYKARDESADPYLASFESREDAHVLKIAALLSINRRAWEIKKEDMLNAISIVDHAKRCGAKLFCGIDTKATTSIDKAAERIRAVLIGAQGKPVVERDLVRAAQYHANTAMVKHVLNVLHEMRLVKVTELVTNERTRHKTKLYAAEKALSSRKGYEDMIERFNGEGLEA